MMSQAAIADLVAGLLAELRLETESPREAINVLGLALYMLYLKYDTKQDFHGFMKDFDSAMASLHFANDIKGTA